MTISSTRLFLLDILFACIFHLVLVSLRFCHILDLLLGLDFPVGVSQKAPNTFMSLYKYHQVRGFLK